LIEKSTPEEAPAAVGRFIAGLGAGKMARIGAAS